jgi:hypothetical protein
MPLFRSLERPYWVVKLLNFEYWPWWVFFVPMLPLWLWYAMRLRSLAWFAAANPAIEYGGFFGESKIDILNHIPARYKPQTAYFDKSLDPNSLFGQVLGLGIPFPLILKPNVGERGGDVEIVKNRVELQRYIDNHESDLIVQEYVDYAYEFGVLYHRMPEESRGRITSIVMKEFMAVTGNGESSVLELLQNNSRASFQIARWLEEKKELMNTTPATGEVVQIEAIGNHCLGTKFLDAGHLNTERLEHVFDEISNAFEGFNYGRFDLKCNSLEEFGRGESLKIFELNGVSSEPGHIYDPKHHVLYAYSEIIRHWTIIYRVCKMRVRIGFKQPRAKEVFAVGLKHFKNKKAHPQSDRL